MMFLGKLRSDLEEELAKVAGDVCALSSGEKR
jgi:ubiquinone biosynthesis protein UbiJ